MAGLARCLRLALELEPPPDEEAGEDDYAGPFSQYTEAGARNDKKGSDHRLVHVRRYRLPKKASS